MEGYQATLRRLAIHCDASAVGADATTEPCGLDTRTTALVRIAALVAIDAAPQCYGASVEQARQAGATDEEVVGVLLAAIPVLGAPRVISAAAKLGLALGFDLEAALEDSTVAAPSR